jgi:hypothetical protein
MQKSSSRKYFKFGEIQNKQICDKKLYYFNTIVLPFTATKLSFFIFSKIQPIF